jgi:hypothetical protein
MMSDEPYRIPGYAKKWLASTEGVPWERSQRQAQENWRVGLVRNSFQLFPIVGNVTVFFEAKFDIDGDGADMNVAGDPYHQGNTSLHDARGNPFSSSRMPFGVLPLDKTRSMSAFQAGYNLGLGDLGMAFWTGGRCGFIFADLGPYQKIGEGSICLANVIGVPSNPVSGGIQDVPPGICWLAWPGSRHVIRGKTMHTRDDVLAESEELYQKFLGKIQIT